MLISDPVADTDTDTDTATDADTGRDTNTDTDTRSIGVYRGIFHLRLDHGSRLAVTIDLSRIFSPQLATYQPSLNHY